MDIGLLKVAPYPEKILKAVTEKIATEENQERDEMLRCIVWIQMRRWAEDLGLSKFMDEVIKEELQKSRA